MTRLTAIELVGFKSFADRTRFEFPEGITAIVGPNGSGKSNVVDAMKWVLGEQSVKSLRGKEMADVIFAGSAGRKPLNSAETSLFFDNSAGLLPVESAEVRITRRVYRSGESEYLVNGQISRLRDIRELFSGTGAATEAYSVIEQGRVDALLVASGRDRRLVFEEAAGITRFRSRRAEALRRLERTDQSRRRLADLLGEIAGRLATVRQQAARARRHQELTARLKSLRLTAASIDLASVEEAAAAHADRIARTQEEIGIHEGVLSDASSRLADIVAEEQANDTELASLQQHLSSFAERAAAARTSMGLLAGRSRELDDEALHAAGDLRDLRHRLLEATRAIAEAEQEEKARGLEAAAIRERLAASETTAGSSSLDASQVRDAVASARHVLRETEAAHAASRTAVVRLEDAMARVADAADHSRASVATARERHAQSLDAVATAEGTLTAFTTRLESAHRELAALEGREKDLAELAIARRDAVAATAAKLEACRERALVLDELVGSREGVSESTRAMLAAGVPGSRGLVAESIDAPPAVAALVDAALGQLAGHLLVDSSDECMAWLADLPAVAAGGGRTGFVIADRLPAPSTDAVAAQGVLGRLDRLLSPPPAPNGVAERLLSRVWVVDSLRVAASLAGSMAAGSLFVTPRGEMLSSDGRLEIGSGAGAGLVSRRSELASIPSRIEELERRAESCRRELADCGLEQAGLRDELRRARGQCNAESAAAAAARSELDRLRREAVSKETAIAAAEAAHRREESRLCSIREQLQRARDVERESLDAATAAAVAVARAEARLEAFNRSRGEAIEAVARIRVEEAEHRQRLLAATAGLEARRMECTAARGRLDAAAERLATIDDRRRQHDLDRLVRSSDYAEACWHAERLAAQRADLLDTRDRLSSGRLAALSASEQARDAIASLSLSLHEAGLAAGEVRHRRDRIVERIRDDYGLDIEAERAAAGGQAEPYPGDRDALEREIEEHRRRLAAMPSVNLEAVAEAEALESRHGSMQAQLSDLTDAKQAVESLIAKIDEESRRLLAETIETVRGQFQGLFENLFGGGQADIVLDPNVDLLDTTVEIVARPPGKEPRSISLLSGGEKTMTCVALLLAIFKSRPSPFCVLDEVDAALDEANVDRFVGVLRDFLSSTQFIVVTHSKKTMAAADTLYGVTMEESGVSKRVAVRLEQARVTLAKAA